LQPTPLPSENASISQLGQLQPTPQGDFQVYVGNLDQNVNNAMLMKFFQQRYSSLIEAKVISDPVTKISKGYGFLRFSQQQHAS
jgi:RNA recognition motif-containing protein